MSQGKYFFYCIFSCLKKQMEESKESFTTLSPPSNCKPVIPKHIQYCDLKSYSNSFFIQIMIRSYSCARKHLHTLEIANKNVLDYGFLRHKTSLLPLFSPRTLTAFWEPLLGWWMGFPLHENCESNFACILGLFCKLSSQIHIFWDLHPEEIYSFFRLNLV